MSVVIAAVEVGNSRRRVAVSVLFLAAFINILDVTIVNLALPEIRSSLGASDTQLAWILVVYVLAFASGLLPFGRFGDVFGRKKVFLWGTAGFLGSSAICGLAADPVTLIAARAFQGLSAAMMVPQVLAIVHVLFQADDRGRIIGLYGAVNGLGAVAGPVIGGAILAADIAGLGWRPIFLLNIPFGLLSLIGAMRFVPNVACNKELKPDWLGTALFSLCVLSLTYPLVEGRHVGWPWWCLGLLGVATLLAGLFLKQQASRAARGLTQLLPVSLLRDRDFVVGVAVVVGFFAGVAGVFFMLAILLQSGFGYSPLVTGMTLAPHPVGAMIASYLTGRFGNRWLDQRIILGAGLLAIGMTALFLIISNAQDRPAEWHLMMPLFCVGLGMGTAVAALFQSVLTRVSGPDAGAGSGVLQAFQQVGIIIGIAVTGEIFFSGLNGRDSLADFAKAAQTALWFPIGVYVMLIIVSLWLALQSRRS